MLIKNITSNEIVVAGLILSPNESRPLIDIGSKDDIYRSTTEIIDLYYSNTISLIDIESNEITDINRIFNTLNGNVTEVTIKDGVDISPLPDEDNTNSDDTTNPEQNIELTGKEYYYNNTELELVKGQVTLVTFKGYLKNSLLRVYQGEVLVNIQNEKMNKVKIEEQNVFELDSDYKILNPVIRIEATKHSILSLFADGLYYDSEQKKSKQQYLDEIYGKEELPEPIIPDDKIKNYSIDFSKQDLYREVVTEDINHVFGTTKGFDNSTDTPFTRSTCIDMKNTINIGKDLDFTHSTWFNIAGTAVTNQYLYYKSSQFYVYITKNNSMYVSYAGKFVKVSDLTPSIWNNLIVTYSAELDTINVYLNGLFMIQVPRTHRFRTSTSSFYIGNIRSSYNKYGFVGDIKSFSTYNYFLSSGMVSHLYREEHPNNQIQTNTITGVRLKYFSLNRKVCTSGLPSSKIDFDILEKEYRNIENIIFNETLDKINFIDSNLDDVTNSNYLSTAEGIFEVKEESYFKFKIYGDDVADLSIDDRPVAFSNKEETTGTIYLKEGKYNLKFRHMNLEETSAFYCKIYSIEDADYINFNLLQYDIEDTESSEEEKNTLLTINSDDITSKNSISVDKNTSETYTDNDISKDFVRFKGNNSINLSSLSDICLDSTFSISTWYKPLSTQEHYIFTLGNKDKDYLIWLGLRYTNNWNEKLELIFCDNRISLDYKVTGYSKIDIVSNGSVLLIYLNGTLVNKQLDYKENEVFRGDSMCFNALPSTNSFRYMESDYLIDNFKYINAVKTKEQIEQSYLEEKSKYLN